MENTYNWAYIYIEIQDFEKWGHRHMPLIEIDKSE